MEMHGSRPLAFTQAQAWQALNDPATLRTCIPGCEKFESSGENQYTVGMTVKVGPVSAKFTGKVVLSDVVPPASYTIAFEGQGGAAGFGKGKSSVVLTPTPHGCKLEYTVHAQVGGKIAQLGQRLVDGAAKAMADDFFSRFGQELQRQHAGAPEVNAPTPKEPSRVASTSSWLRIALAAFLVAAGLLLAFSWRT